MISNNVMDLTSLDSDESVQHSTIENPVVDNKAIQTISIPNVVIHT